VSVVTVAHIAGVPVEEVVPSFVGASTALVLALTWAMSQVRRRGRGALRRGRCE
jgi:hypothetical protein